MDSKHDRFYGGNGGNRKEVEIPWTTESLLLVIESAPDAVIMVNEDGDVVLVNSQAENFFQYSRGELLGQPVEMLIPERYRGNHADFRSGYFVNPVLRAMGEGRDLFGRRKDGSEFPVEIGLAPLKISKGFFVLCSIVDITVRKQLEARTQRINEIKVQESERRHLARELHDEIAQLLSAISVDLKGAKGVCATAADRLNDSIRFVERAIEQVRDLMLDLRPPMLDDLGLVATLRWLADRQTKRAGIVLSFVAESSGSRLPSDHATACYRIVQAALANVIRHSKARHVWIEFHNNDEEIRLTIRDDGIGFNPTAIQPVASGKSSFGMLGMKERVEILGGRLEIKSHLDQGTVIDVCIPLVTAESSQRRDE